MKDTFCSYCGTKFNSGSYPKACEQCNNITYLNPIPICLVILAVYDDYKLQGYLIQKRGIEPKKDEWAFTSGYLEFGETFQEGSARETYEELGIKLDPNTFSLYKVLNATNGNLLIVSWNHITVDDLKLFSPNREVLDILVIKKNMKLAFPTHTALIKEIVRNSKFILK